LIFDAQGTLLYPAPLEARVPKAPPQGRAWEEAQAAEFERRGYNRAAHLYAAGGAQGKASDAAPQALPTRNRALGTGGKRGGGGSGTSGEGRQEGDGVEFDRAGVGKPSPRAGPGSAGASRRRRP